MMDWSRLKKGDELYLMVPSKANIGNYLTYNLQYSQVIAIKPYEWCVNIRFKYTDSRGKRQRINLCINRLKFELPIVSTNKETSYAKSNEICYGDLLVAYDKSSLINSTKEIIENQIQKNNIKLQEIYDYNNFLEGISYILQKNQEFYNKYPLYNITP